MNLADWIAIALAAASMVGSGVIWLTNRREREERIKAQQVSTYDKQSLIYERRLDALQADYDHLRGRFEKLREEHARLESKYNTLLEAFRNGRSRFNEP